MAVAPAPRHDTAALGRVFRQILRNGAITGAVGSAVAIGGRGLAAGRLLERGERDRGLKLSAQLAGAETGEEPLRLDVRREDNRGPGNSEPHQRIHGGHPLADGAQLLAEPVPPEVPS